MKVDGIAKSIAGWINKSERAQSTLKSINRNPAIFSAIASFGLASICRPLAIGMLPFSNDKDKKCSQASSVSAGLVELLATVAVFIPLNKSIEKTSKSLYHSTATFYSGNNVALRQFKSVTNRGFKLLFLIPISLLRFALVKPLMNKVFNDKNEAMKVVEEIKEKVEEERKLDKWV